MSNRVKTDQLQNRDINSNNISNNVNNNSSKESVNKIISFSQPKNKFI